MDSTSSSYNKNGTSGLYPPIEGDMEEKMNVTPTEVVDVLSVTPVLLHDTESSNTMVSNLDHSVSTEPKSDERKEDTSKTKETPDVLVDNESNEEGLIEEDDNNKTIRLSRESPEVLSDQESERMVEEENAICNPSLVQDAFVFCPIMGSFQMESILPHGIFRSETEMTEMKFRKHSFYYNFTNITFVDTVRNKSKMQAVEDVLRDMK